MSDNELVEISPANDGLNSMQGEGVQPAPEQEKPAAEKSDVKAEKPSLDDTLKKAFKASEEKGKEPKAEKPAATPEPKPVQESTTAEKPVVDEKARSESKPSEGKRFDTAPSRMLPEASQRWANVPNEVKAEVHRAFDDFEREKQGLQEHVKFREELKEYEDLGKQHGVSLKQALDNYVGIERKFAEAPGEGFRQLLSNLNMQPQQAISHILNAFNVTPQALAAHMAQSPNEYTVQQRQQAQQQQAQPNPEVQQLRQELASMKEERENEKVHRVYNEMIAPLFQKYQDAERLWPTIEIHLTSGTIEKIHGDSLSGDKKLLEAYRMAGGSYSPSRSEALDDNAHSRTEKRPVNPDAGKLSIGGSSGSGDLKPSNKKKTHSSIDDALANAIRRAS